MVRTPNPPPRVYHYAQLYSLHIHVSILTKKEGPYAMDLYSTSGRTASVVFPEPPLHSHPTPAAVHTHLAELSPLFPLALHGKRR